MFDKAVDNYSHALEFFPDYKKCDKAVNTHPFTKKFVLESYKTQELGNMQLIFYSFSDC